MRSISKNHLEQSNEKVRCSYCDTAFSTTVAMDEHINKTCPLVSVNCILKSYGCEAKILRKDLQEHYMSMEHQRSLLQTERLKNFCQMNRNSHEFLTIDASSKNTITREYEGQVNEINETLNIISRGVQALYLDAKYIQDGLTQQLEQANKTETQLNSIQTSIEETNIQLQAQHVNLSILQEQQKVLRDTIEAHRSVSYDGTLIWKISNVQEKIDDAHSERQISIYSPSFYSSPTGYKMCARLYFLGDGNARQTHMSLFFVLMRGINDPILIFPFKYKVTFCLYDLSGKGKHIIDSFRPDTKSNSFQRPSTEMNIASGIPKFAPVSVVELSNSPYIRDDTMFIKIMVDFENISKRVLSFAIVLNPGLPTEIQQRLIQNEIQKQEQQN